MRSITRSVIVHGHFYQPPREDPWLDEVEAEPSAAPFHDWNERIERECYRAVTAARLLAPDGRIAGVVNTLDAMSFDFGPTLLEWLEHEAPDTYAAVLAADAASRDRLGFGNALATPYHHVILPLASRREKVTEVRWGIADFRRRFGRAPEGMWLPETAVDPETLDVLAAEGIAFTILAPRQVGRAPQGGLPGRYRTPGGRTIAVFVYDGAISHDVAFGPLVRDGRHWAERLLAGPPGTVVVATDGETYGHHHRFGEMAVAALFADLTTRADVRIENCAAALARTAPREDVELVAPSSWSCEHGVERWRADCGCRAEPHLLRHQRWRAPLRAALDWLAGELHALFEREAAPLLGAPWDARDAYGAVVGAAESEIGRFVAARLRSGGAPGGAIRARELLELECDALRMFTSCGWFFDDVAGLEARQVLRYAAHAIDLAGGDRSRLETGFLERLARVPTNDPQGASGRELFEDAVRPRVPPSLRVAAGYAAARHLGVAPEAAQAPGVRVHETADGVVLTHGRTGRTDTCTVTVHPTRPGVLAVEVAAPGGPPARLGVADLPDRQRAVVVAALCRSLTEHLLAPHAAGALAAGRPLDRLAKDALVAAVHALRRDTSPPAVERVLDLSDLLELLGGHIPWEAQTVFHRIRATAAPAPAAALAAVAWRLGFAPTD
ncbi:MAG TPA: DUF3536 domain-containing protein [Gemmatimonadales bacterium]|nr:DUF3536 domain-containing protein [Gemmatimonadales bacterium]